MHTISEYAPAGSDIYYVLRQVAPEKKSFYLALHAYAQELYKTSEHYKEVAIAQKKLIWWVDEIKNLYQGAPKHPLTKILQDAIGRYQLKEIELLAMIEAAMLATTTQIFMTEAELRQHYQHTGGIVASLKAKILDIEKISIDAGWQNKVHQLGSAYEILRHLLNFPKSLHRQHLYLPLSLFQEYQIDPQPILQNKNLSTLVPLLNAEFESAKKLIITTKLALTPLEQKHLRPLLLELELKLKQVQKTAKAAWKIFDYHLELSPLFKLLFTEFAP
jgi:phytoene synthase